MAQCGRENVTHFVVEEEKRKRHSLPAKSIKGREWPHRHRRRARLRPQVMSRPFLPASSCNCMRMCAPAVRAHLAGAQGCRDGCSPREPRVLCAASDAGA